MEIRHQFGMQLSQFTMITFIKNLDFDRDMRIGDNTLEV